MTLSFSKLLRRARIVVFTMTALMSIFLITMYSLFLKNDFAGYSKLQRGDMVWLAVVNGVTALAMWLILTNRYHLTVEAVVAVVIFALQTAGTTVFTIQPNSMTCNAFGGGDMCRTMYFVTDIVNWALCGLLFLFGACVAIVACRPSEEDSALRSLTMSSSPRPASINSLTRLVSNDVEKQVQFTTPRMQNPYSLIVSNVDPAAMYRTDTRSGMGMARQPMMTPRPTPGAPRPVRPTTRPTLIVPPRAALAQRMPSARGAASNLPRMGVAPPPPRILNPAERAAVVKAGGGMEWRKLVLDADYL